MRVFKILLISVFILLIVGFSGKDPIPMEGIYSVKLRTLTYFDLVDMSKQKINPGGKVAELTESKPDELALDFDINNLNQPLFGTVKFGNSEQVIWFVIGQNEQQYYTEMYLDQDMDNRITENEKIKGVQVFDSKIKSLKVKYAFTMIPIATTVVYKGEENEIRKKLYFYIFAQNVSNKRQNEAVVEFYTASFLDGEMKVLKGKETKIVKFRIIDADGNGCFNDYGKDILLIDKNLNGVYDKSERYALTEYYDYVDSSKQKHQLRMVVLPIPSKVAVTGANINIDKVQLEASSDKIKEDEPESDNKEAEELEKAEETDNETNK